MSLSRRSATGGGRRRRVALIGAAAGLAAAALVWTVARGRAVREPDPDEGAVKTWRGGETNSCMVTVDGARLQSFASRYALVMVCGVEREGTDRATDRAVTVSRSFPIEPREIAIEEALSGPMRVLLEERARAARDPAAPPGPDWMLPEPREESLWYEVVLLPSGADAFDVRTLADAERLGGRRLLAEPRQTVIAVRY